MLRPRLAASIRLGRVRADRCSFRSVQLDGSTALLTGATGGLGQAIAQALAAAGARVLLTGRRAELLEEVRARLGDGAVSLPADLAEPGAAAELARRAGDVDVLVANAGLPGSGRA